jgi:peptidoglycan/xylan/chitin deacetylase (PgdA/CDA1 family)
MYHYVRPEGAGNVPQPPALDPRDFETQISALCAVREPIHFDEFAAHVTAGRAFNGSRALLTFDDGFVDHYAYVLPCLRERRLSAVFFLAGLPLAEPPRVLNVHKTHFLNARLGAARFAEAVRMRLAEPAGAVATSAARASGVYRYDGGTADADVKHLLNYELPFAVADQLLSDLFAAHFGDEASFARTLYLSVDQIKEMAQCGMTFGYHTRSHPVLARLSAAEQLTELRDGVETIRNLTGQSSVPFCYPYGHRHTYGPSTVEALDACGYSHAFNTVRELVEATAVNRFEIPRFDTRDLPPFAAEWPHA